MNLLSVWETTHASIDAYVKLGAEVKKRPERYSASLSGKTLAMLFEKSSTRTRVSFENAMYQLGGHSTYLDFAGSQLSRGESISDTGKVLGRYVSAIMARLYRQADLIELAKHSGVPVINGLTDDEHPCQALADIMTMHERGKVGKGRKFAFVGDCSFNMANSLMLVCAKSGMDVALVCPAKYPPNEKFVKEAKKHSKVAVEHDPKKGVEGADVIYTDTWVSMGQEGEKASRISDFTPYQINSKLLSHAKEDAIVMHCLPAHRGLEITSDVLDGPQSAVWDQAENRLHIQKAILLKLLEKA